jgi:hypothetical protein
MNVRGPQALGSSQDCWGRFADSSNTKDNSVQEGMEGPVQEALKPEKEAQESCLTRLNI